MILLGDRLKELRTQKKLSMSKLSDLSGISKTTISDIENHKVNATINTLDKLAKALNVNINYLTSPSEYDKDKIVLLESGFFSIDNISNQFNLLPSVANLIKYSDKNFDLTTLHDDDWYSLLENIKEYIEFELFKINEKRKSEFNGSKEK